MDMKLLLTVFTTVFLAEMADKTQLATMLYASDKDVSRLTVFLGAALALIAASALAVFVGAALSHWINERLMARVAGVAFILIGLWTLMKA